MSIARMFARTNGGQVQGVPAQHPPSLNSLLAAALPPRFYLRQLELRDCCLDAVSLRQLPVLSSLQRLDVKGCWTANGMDEALRALVQAPALTSLHLRDGYLCCRVPSSDFRPGTWPAYLLAHPSLRSVTLLSSSGAKWDTEQALLPSTAAAQTGGLLLLRCSGAACCCIFSASWRAHCAM